MNHDSEDTLIIQIKRPSVRKFQNSIGMGQKTPSSSLRSFETMPQSDDLTFVMTSDDRGKRSYEAIKLIKPPTPIEETVSRIKVGSWRTEVKTKDSILTRKSSEGSKIEMVRCILNDLIVNIKPEEGIQGSISSYYHIQIADQLRLERIQRQQERQFKGRVSSIQTITRSDQHLSKGPRLSSVVKECGLASNIVRTDPALETKTHLDRVSLSSDTSSKLDSLEGPVPEVTEEEITRVSGVDLKYAQKSPIHSPFELKWCFGYDPDVPIVNLSTHDRSFILFASSQFSVLFDFHKQTMNFLQGHHNRVASIAADSQGSVMVTADSGPGSRVIFWDSQPCVLNVLEDVHPRGTRLVGLSTHAEYLVTVSPAPDQIVQLWAYPKYNSPAAMKPFSGNLGEIKKLTMNRNLVEEFALISDAGMTFVFYEKYTLKEVSDMGRLIFDSHQTPFKLGTVTGTTFLPDDDAAALTSTSKGYVIVWTEEGGQHKKVYKKHVHLHFESIKHIEVVDGLVALATVSGNVSFYDLKLKILFWIKLQMGDLKCLSFNLFPQVPGSGVLTCDSEDSCSLTWHNETKRLVDATLQNSPIRVRHFVACSESGQLAYFNPTIGIPKNIFYPSSAACTAISIHPDSHYFCAGTTLGHCILFDIDDYKMKITQKLSGADNSCEAVSCLQYSPSGFRLACGMYAGAVWLLHPLFLTPVFPKPLSIGSNCITHLLFSPDSNFLAVGDTGSVVALYSMLEDPVLLGQYKAHNRPIADLLFVKHNSVKLLSLGTDRFIVEFHVEGSTEEASKELVFNMSHRVEQTDIPRCILPYPADEKYFLMINSDLKFKLLDVHSLKCCKTLQAPNFGYSIKFLEPFSSGKEYKLYLLFGSEKHIGIHKLPVDGNPYRALAYQASPTSIVCCKVHRNGKYVFTVSESGKSIDMWEVNTTALEEHYKSGGEGMEPFWNMLEGGKGGWRERDIREFFTVGQFAHQGERPSVVRSPIDNLHVCEIASVFQALGFYPTKYQINNLLFEVTGRDPRSLMAHFKHRAISLEQFVLLYVNHRPSQHLSLQQLQQAFNDLYHGTFFSVCENDLFRRKTQPIFSADIFVEQLMNLGEESSYGELIAAFSMLCDKEPDLLDEHHLPTGLLSFIPKELSFETLLHDVLGLTCELPPPFYQFDN